MNDGTGCGVRRIEQGFPQRLEPNSQLRDRYSGAAVVLEPISGKYPRVLGLLHRMDRGISHLPLFRTIGDHMLLYFEPVEGDVLEPASGLSPFFSALWK